MVVGVIGVKHLECWSILSATVSGQFIGDVSAKGWVRYVPRYLPKYPCTSISALEACCVVSNLTVAQVSYSGVGIRFPTTLS